MPLTVIKPIRNVVTIAVDEQHLRRPVRSDPSQPADAVEFCVIKRNTIALYSLRERLFFQKVNTLQASSDSVRACYAPRCMSFRD